jgi:peptidyl-dipeptidase A
MVELVLAAALYANDFAALRDQYLEQYRPLYVQTARAWWKANISGADADFARKADLEKQISRLQSDKSMFARIKALKESGTVTDPLEARQLDVMYRQFLANQADPKLQERIIELQNQVEQAFNTHRSMVNGKEMTENQVREVLRNTIDSKEAEAAWKGYMAVGEKAAGKLREMVKLRNQIARELGFRDYFAMALAMQEIDETLLMSILDELHAKSQDTFSKMKDDIDARRAAIFGIQPAELRPWHFGDLFFQEAPPGGEVDFDRLYSNVDILALTRAYYAGLGMDVNDILDRSDLYEKPGKSPHAFCADLDREGDIRVLCNIKPNQYWADTTLHELGHGVYAKYVDRNLPWLLRESCHAILDEGQANMFGAIALNEDWLANVVKLAPDLANQASAAARQMNRTDKLIFAQWAQVMVRFEREMYANPEQNLGKLWWDLRSRYQRLPAPATTSRPDYAAKVHILTSPVYYHSYLLGDVFGAQLRNHIVTKILGERDIARPSFANRPKVGEFLKAKLFGMGNRQRWDELIQHATGEKLTAKYFVELYAK